MVSKALSERNTKNEMLIIDLAMPRDVEPSVAGLKGLKLFNIDELVNIADEYRRLRQDEAKRAEAIVAEEVNAFWKCWRSKWAEQLVVSLLNSAEAVRMRTLEEFSGKLATCDDGERKAIDMLTRRLIKRLLHPLIKGLKEMPSDTDDQMAFDAVVKLLQPFLEKGDGK
jgi:glutamyl-tRNA reductase